MTAVSPGFSADHHSAPALIALSLVTSTQAEAKAQAHQGCAHGVVVVAQEQSAGRGRRGRTWLSGRHGLWMSMVLRVDLPMTRAPRLSLCACAAVADVLHKAAVDVFVKWPNDLMVAAPTSHPVLGCFRKAGGLLIEAVDVEGDRLRTAVLGVGINLSAPAGGFTADLGDSAGALTDAGFDVEALPRLALAALLQTALIHIAPHTDDAAFAAVRQQLSARSATLGRVVRVEGPPCIVGTAIGFSSDGALQIEDHNTGEVHLVHAGDVMLA